MLALVSMLVLVLVRRVLMRALVLMPALVRVLSTTAAQGPRVGRCSMR